MVGRLIGWIFVALAAVVAGGDALAAIEAGTVRLVTLGELWFRLSPDTLNLAQAAIQRYVHPWLWDPTLVTLLLLPAVLVLLALGALLIFAFRRPERRRLFR